MTANFKHKGFIWPSSDNKDTWDVYHGLKTEKVEIEL